jgi:hypothetical protein
MRTSLSFAMNPFFCGEITAAAAVRRSAWTVQTTRNLDFWQSKPQVTSVSARALAFRVSKVNMVKFKWTHKINYEH